MLEVALATLDDPHVIDLVTTHHAHCMALTPPESVHALNLDGLKHPSITLWAASVEGEMAGIGALRALSECEGEIKTMHTKASMRGKGVGAAILEAILAAAQTRRYTDVYLETGTPKAFEPARRLYETRGFNPCPPFADYRPDPHSAYYRLELTSAEAAA
ncbi:MAG: GNAT family N-acetyltransferase [Pseudomonadota bacterium]